MDVITKFLDKYSYRFPKGYPDLTDPADKKLMQELLSEVGINLLEDDQNSELVDIFDYVGSDNSLTKVKLFDRLAEYTYQYYSNEMGELKTVFPDTVNTISGKTSEGSWRDYTNERESNIGKEVETCIINYSNEVKKVKATDVADKGRGQDAVIGGKTVEIKSSKGNTINTQLQTTWYSPTKFYAFVTNTSSKNIEVRVIYGDILIKLSLGKEIANSANLEEIGDKLEKQIEDGLAKLPFASMIKASLISTEPVVKESTSFKIGNRLKVRFVIYFEPAYGKEKGKNNEELEENLDEEYLYND
jgi:hypothetical protein